MSNTNLLILADANRSHQFRVLIKKPDGTLYKTFSSNQVLGNIDPSSYATSKSFDAPPVVLNNLLSAGLNENIILSRQLVSWPAEIVIVSSDGSTEITNSLWVGRVNGFSKSGGYWSIELTNSIIDLDKGGVLSLSSNCPLVFGKCGATKTSTEISPIGLQTPELEIVPISFTPVGSQRYEVFIGDTAYNVTGFVNNSGGLLIKLRLDRIPAACPEVAFLRNTCNQSIEVCREGYNNLVNYRGVSLPSSVLSLQL